MDHPPPSSTTIKEEDNKKAKASTVTASSSSSAAAAINDDAPPLPPHHRHHFYDIPDIAHDAIASYLTVLDIHCMMESSLWLMEVYGGKVKELELDCDKPMPPTSTMLSLMSRRPGIQRVTVSVDDMMRVLVMAMRNGYVNRLHVLEVRPCYSGDRRREHLRALRNCLADSLCPNLHTLAISHNGDMLPSLGDALRSRMEKGKGCCGLKSLVLEDRPPLHFLQSVLSSGACEALEEFKIKHNYRDDDGTKDVSEWMSRTKAPKLRAFTSLRLDDSLATALCSPGVAPRLQVLEVEVSDVSSIILLTEMIGDGYWPDLKEIKAMFWESQATEAIPDLVDAIGVGAPQVTTLHLTGVEVGPEGCTAVARMLKDGGCPRLEELNLKDSQIDDDAVVELVRALEGGAPCNTTLQRLNLEACDITSVGMMELAQAMGRGVLLPNLECLNLDSNEGIGSDGVIALAQAMSGGALRSLRQIMMRDVGMEHRGAVALFQALRDHKPCPHLSRIDVGLNSLIGDAVVELAKAIEVGALQHLQQLNLVDVSMGEEGFKSLVKALAPGCPRLRKLDVRNNPGIGDGGVTYLAEMMRREGAMQQLRELSLDQIAVSMEGVKVLFQALGDGPHICPNLKQIKMGSSSIITANACPVDRERLEPLEKELILRRGRWRRSSSIRITVPL